MSVPFDPTELTDELADLRRRVEDQAEELAALRERPGGGPVSRRGLLLGLAGAGAAGMATLAGAPPAAAADDDPLILGQENASTTPTTLTFSGGAGIQDEALAIVVDQETPPPEPFVPGALSVVGTDVAITASGHFLGALFQTDTGFAAVLARATEGGVGLAAQSDGGGPAIGAQASDGVQLFLNPAGRTGPPTATTRDYMAGCMSLDNLKDLWICTEAGSPGVWTRLLRADDEDTSAGRVMPVAPFRALDTRAIGGRPAGAPAIPGQIAGPLHAGQTVTLDLAGHDPLPDAISAVVGNVTVVSPNYAGFLRAFPEGTPSTTSAVNFTSGAIVGNGFTSGLGPGGLSLLSPAPASRTYHLVVDITAYIT